MTPAALLSMLLAQASVASRILGNQREAENLPAL